MPCVKVTTDALQIQFLFVFIIIKVCGNTILIDSFRKQILVTFLTRFVRYIFNGMLQSDLVFQSKSALSFVI